MSGVGRGSKLWFSQFPTMVGLSEERHVTSTPHNHLGRASADAGVDGESPLSGRDVHVLSDLVKQIGTSIGENIVSCLKSLPANEANVTQSTTADLRLT